MLIMIDGPENSGKTTVIARLAQLIVENFGASVIVEKQSGRATPNEDIYIHNFRRALFNRSTVTIWDRGWVSEFVYGRILNQDRPMAKNPELGWWKFDRFVAGEGIGVILSGDDTEKMDSMRDDTDVDTEASIERALFEDYATTFGLTKLRNKFMGEEEIDTLAMTIAIRAFVHSGPPMAAGSFPNLVGNLFGHTCLVSVYRDGQDEAIPFENDYDFIKKNFPQKILNNSVFYSVHENLFFNDGRWKTTTAYPNVVATDKETFEFLSKKGIQRLVLIER